MFHKASRASSSRGDGVILASVILSSLARRLRQRCRENVTIGAGDMRNWRRPPGVQNRCRDFVEPKLRLAERARLTRAFGPRPSGAPPGVQNRCRDFVEPKLRFAERARLTLAFCPRASSFPSGVQNTSRPFLGTQAPQWETRIL